MFGCDHDALPCLLVMMLHFHCQAALSSWRCWWPVVFGASAGLRRLLLPASQWMGPWCRRRTFPASLLSQSYHAGTLQCVRAPLHVSLWHCTVLVVAFNLKHHVTATARGCLVLVVCIIIAQAVLRLSTIMMFSAGLLVCHCVSARESTTSSNLTCVCAPVP